MNPMADIEEFDDIGFISLSSLLSIHQRQQETDSHDAAGDTESMSSEDWDADSNDESTTQNQLSRLTSKDRQLKKFLDYMTETFSREKSAPLRQAKRHARRRGNIKGKGASHVTASGLAMLHREPTVFFAKNGGVENADRELARNLTTWIRAIAATTKRPTIDNDTMWAKLLKYNKQRLDTYATQIESFSESEFSAAGPDGATLAKELHVLSVEYKMDGSLDILQRKIFVAYKLRYEPATATLAPHSRRLRISISFLGRLRSAYEAFKEAAIVFQKSFAKLTVVCLQAPTARLLSKSLVEKRIRELASEHAIPQPKKDEFQKTLGKAIEILAPCHAEIQLLLHFECSLPLDTDPFPYFGCSKKSCWLCHELLSRYKDKRTDTRGFYQTRRSHGRVYPLWRIPLAAYPQANPRVHFNLSASLQDIKTLMFERLLTIPRKQLPAVAESSANVTTNGGALKQRALAKSMVAESSRSPKRVESEIHILKEFLCSRMCMRIPATGKHPHLLSIKFYDCPSHYPGHEPQNFRIPDFSAFWDTSNFDRGFRQIEVKERNPAELNGECLFYWCRNDALPPNKYLVSLLGLQSLRIDEHFWYGDVFIVRFHKDDQFKFHCEDVPQACLDHMEWIHNSIYALWHSKALEDEIQTWQNFDVINEKIGADKEILLQRM